MARKGTKVKTQVGELNYVFITGEGRNGAMPGEPERPIFTASIVTKKDSELHKSIKAQINAEWEAYRNETGTKGAPASTGVRDVMVETDELDEYGARKKVPSGDVLITFKTSTTWADGKPQTIKVFDGKGNDITTAVHNASWTIGNGSTGIIHGTAMGNNVGGKAKVSLYLTAIQLAKLSKYEGSSIDVDSNIGEEIDLGDNVAAISTSDKPDI